MSSIATENQNIQYTTESQSNRLESSISRQQQAKSRGDLLAPLRQWLDGIDINHPALANRIARLIPAQCPFERNIQLFGYQIVRIPPLCKLNPFYEQFVSLRFRALCYLADECGEDIRSYC